MKVQSVSKSRPGPLRVAGLLLPDDQAGRLSDMGLRAGCDVVLLQTLGDGGAVLALGDTRIAIDGRTASRVRVTSIEGDAP